MADRNAASVLPLPVGAQISVCSPADDRRPALDLGRRRLGERRGEPGPHGGRERLEHRGDQRWFRGYRGGVTASPRAPGQRFSPAKAANSRESRRCSRNRCPLASPVPAANMNTRAIPSMRADRQTSDVPYLPGLDGMRALAVVAVMVYHANPAWLPGGFLGVEVFFVISGYLITLLLIGEHERTGRVALGAVLAAPGPPAAAGAVHAARRRSPCTPRCSGATRSAAARRRHRRAHVRVELVPDLGRPGVHRVRRLRPAAPPVEPRRRGAVLPAVAARDGRCCCASAGAACRRQLGAASASPSPSPASSPPCTTRARSARAR